MPSTNKTTPYNLPQYVGTDRPSFTGEITQAFKTINDTMQQLNASITAADEAAESAASAAQSAQQAAQTAQQAASTAQTAANNAVNLLVDLGVTDEETAAAFKAKVDNAVPKYAILASYFDDAE